MYEHSVLSTRMYARKLTKLEGVKLGEKLVVMERF